MQISFAAFSCSNLASLSCSNLAALSCSNLAAHSLLQPWGLCVFRTQRTTCISQDFWPPLKPKIKSVFTTLSLDCFIR